MSVLERRQAAHAALRQKINQIQANNQTLKTAIDQMEVRLIDSARHPGAWPMSETLRDLRRLEKQLQSQTASWMDAQADITGEVGQAPRGMHNEPLITSDEMAALMKLHS